MEQSVIHSLASIREGLPYLLPELVLGILFISSIFSGLIFRKPSQGNYLFLAAIPAFALHCFYALQLLDKATVQTGTLLFEGSISLNKAVIAYKILFSLIALLGLLFILLNEKLADTKARASEYIAFIAALLLGADVLVSSVNLLLIFLSFELISVTSYILVNIHAEKKTAEGAIKYLLFGLFASAIMLYGISFLYGLTGTLNLTSAAFETRLPLAASAPVLFAMVCILCGVLFKISAFPFHIWTPDVYEGTPHATVAFFSSIAKAAGFGLLVHLYHAFGNYDFSGLLPGFTLGLLMLVLAIASITIGNFAALAQKNVKRMLGYSAIAQAGFLLLPFTNAAPAQDILFFYLGIYLWMNMAAFYLAEKLSAISGSDALSSFSGLGLKHPLLGVLSLILMISLTGLPPTLGFSTKLLLFADLWDTYTTTGQILFLIALAWGLLHTVIGLFYYLKIPYYLFFKKENTDAAHTISKTELGVAFLLIAPLLIFFFATGYIFDWVAYCMQ